MKSYRTIHWFLLPALLCCLLPALCPSVADAGMTPDLEASLQTMSSDDAVPVIVTFAANRPSAAAALQGGRRSRAAALRSLHATARTRRQEVSTILGARSVSRARSLWLIDALAVTATPGTIRRLAAMDGVAGVRIDRRHDRKDILMALTDPSEGNITQVGAPALWTLGHLGQGTTVGLMDSGADLQHPDLAATWRGGTNSWLDPYGQYATPVDPIPNINTSEAGHGTAVLSLMVGGDAGGTNIGMAPKARWIAARMFDDNDQVTDSVIHEIFQWFLDPDHNTDTDDAPDVINGSWGLLDDNGQPGACVDEFQEDITRLNDAGIATVFAAGNYGPDIIGTTAPGSISPANYTYAIAVGAVASDDSAAYFSSLGPSACDGRIYPDVVAPGMSVKAANLSFGGLATYVSISGTSFSAPHATGALALLAGAFPDATADDLKTALLKGAVDLGEADPDNVYGNGRIAVDDTTGAFAYLKDTLDKSPCQRPEIYFSAAPAPGPGTLGEPITFTATVAGSGGPYTYAWDIDGDGTADSSTSTADSSSTFEHTYGTAYAGSVGLTVTDAAVSDCPAALIVADQWSCPAFTAAITAQPDPVTAGRYVTFTGSATGGTSPYTFAWDLDGDGGADCTTATCTHTYTAAGDQTIALTATDAAGCSASSQTTLTVVPMPEYCLDMTVTIAAQPDPATADNQVTLTGSATGGTSPYTFAWDLDGDGSTDCTTATCTHTYTAAGNQTITLTSLDADVCSASARKTLTVADAPAVSTGSGGGGSGCFIDVLHSNTGTKSLSR
jgi:PKD repeat protein